MNLKKMIILFLAFVLLAGYVYIVEFKQHDKKEAARAEELKVLPYPADSVLAMSFINGNGQFKVKRIQGSWKLVEPLYTDADQNVVKTMLSGFETAKKANEISIKKSDYNDFGVGSRAFTVIMETEGGVLDTFKLGDKTPVGDNIYVREEDTLIYQLPETVRKNFDKKLFDIRDKKMLDFERDDVTQIILINHSLKIIFDKQGQNDWMIRNIKRPANSSKISGLISKLQNNVKAFVDEDGKETRKYGIDKAPYSVQLNLGPQQGMKKVVFSKKIEGKYYGYDESRKPIFEVDPGVVKDVEMKLADFRDTDFAKIDRDKTSQIRITYADTSIAMLKDSTNNWKLDDGVTPVPMSDVSALLSSLDYTTISEFVTDYKFNDATYGFDKPALKIELLGNNDTGLLTVTLGKTKSDKIYATTSAYESVYLIPASKLKDFKKINLDKLKKNNTAAAITG